MKFKTQYTKRERDNYKIKVIDEKLILELDPNDDRKLIQKDKIKMSDFINESRDLTNFKKYITIDNNNTLIYNKEARPATYADLTFLKKSGAENIQTIKKAKKTIDKITKAKRKAEAKAKAKKEIKKEESKNSITAGDHNEK